MVDIFDVAGRTALVTGGGSGIGLSIATALARAGATVVICGRKRDRLEAAARAIGATTLVADLSDGAAILALAQAVASRVGSLDILVNNAGRTWVAPIGEVPADGWDKVFALNVRAPFLLVQALLPLIEAAAQNGRGGRIVTVSSARARLATGSSAAYNASKAAVEHLTRVLACDLAARNITVNAIAPGWFETAINRDRIAATRASLAASVPLERLGDDADIAGAVLYLCSRAGAYLTGQVLAIDGGLTIGR